MLITVAICTWNRADVLEKTLSQLRQLCVPAGIEWELVVVNNNSTDRTDEVIASFGSHLPIRRVFEPEQGIAAARNASKTAACGEYMLCLDDDIQVTADWLTSYLGAFERWPQADFFGGPIVPCLEPSAPAWAHAMVDSQFGTHQMYDRERLFSRNGAPFGGNMAFRTAVLRHYYYCTNLGRKGEERLAGEECKLFRDLKQGGKIGVWVPDVPVRHLILPEQMTTDFLIKNAHFAGRSTVLIREGETLALLRQRLKYYLCSGTNPIKSAWERWRHGEVSLRTQIERAWMQGFSEELATQSKRAA